ncbi:MAG: 2OG-Fe(II) oxygenase [Planctomycetota bacterium]|jgi:peroxiredoxin/predicted 2-oxoglutarate/Fe(II)-dependent dioxygenase YbiX
MRFSGGEPVPWFSAPTHTTSDFQFSAAAGRYVVLSFLGSASRPDVQRVIADVEDSRTEFDDDRLCFFGVTIDPDDIRSGRMKELLPGIRYFQDFTGYVSRGYDALPKDLAGVNAQTDYRPYSLLLDERLRVLQQFPVEPSGEGHVAKILDLVRTLPSFGEQEPAEVQAPVLIVPRIFEPDFCTELIEYYRTHESEDSGFMRDQGGKTVGVYDYSTKRRRDCQIEDEDIRNHCMHRIHDRLVPEIRRAYQFNATRMERYIVACYEGEHGGHFRAHRDNTTKGTAHRRFAVSVNLNADFEGGYVWFPEFGRQLFRPPAGGAVVFSCSLLHEATPVTSGTRYVFLPFLYDDAAAKVREANLEFLGGNVNAPPGQTT